MKRDILFLLYIGGPDKASSVETFLYNLFSDRDIINFRVGGHLQKVLAKIIAKRRAKKVIPKYLRMGGGSPQVGYISSLGSKISNICEVHRGRSLDVFIGMSYFTPYIEDIMENMSNIDLNEVENLFLMSLYPQYSYVTAGACFKRFSNVFNDACSDLSMNFVRNWHTSQSYNGCIVKRVEEASAKLGKDVSECHILFSAHSLPEYTVRLGDEYVAHVREQINKLVNILHPASHSLGYQSRSGPVKWLGPCIYGELTRLKDDNVKDVILLPISFVSDSIETVIELDEEFIPEAASMGINMVRTSSLNDDDDFAASIVDILYGDDIEKFTDIF